MIVYRSALIPRKLSCSKKFLVTSLCIILIRQLKEEIVYKMTDKWQQVTKNDNEWYNEWQQVTANDNERYSEWQRVVQKVTTNDNEWQRVTTNDNEWQRVVISANFPFFQIKEDPTIPPSTQKRTLSTLRRTLKRNYWIKSRKKPLRENINSKKQELGQFLVCYIYNSKNLWYDTNII